MGEDRDIQADIGAMEREIPVRGGDLRAVGVVVDPVQRVQKAPDKGET